MVPQYLTWVQRLPTPGRNFLLFTKISISFVSGYSGGHFCLPCSLVVLWLYYWPRLIWEMWEINNKAFCAWFSMHLPFCPSARWISMPRASTEAATLTVRKFPSAWIPRGLWVAGLPPNPIAQGHPSIHVGQRDQQLINLYCVELMKSEGYLLQHLTLSWFTQQVLNRLSVPGFNNF